MDRKRKREWTAIPAKRSSLPILNIKLYSILGGLIITAMLGPIAFFLTVSNKGEVTEGKVPNFANVAAARTVLIDWLSGVESSVAVSDEVTSFDRFRGGETEEFSYKDIEYIGEVATTVVFDNEHEIHSFVVTPSNGDRFIVDITLWVTSAGATLAASPSIRPYVKSSENLEALDYLGEVGNATQGVGDSRLIEIIEKWAFAYFNAGSDSAQVLSEIVNDGSIKGEYVGLSGEFEVVDSPEIISFVPDEPTNLLYNDVIDFGTDVGYARVRVLLSNKSAQKWITSVEYDLLVTNLGESNPRIVAWGPGGSAPLQPFSNRKMD